MTLRWRRRHQVQQGGDGSVNIQVGGDLHAPRVTARVQFYSRDASLVKTVDLYGDGYMTTVPQDAFSFVVTIP